MRRLAVAGLVLLLPVPLRAETAQPPVWAMLAECSAVFGAVSRAEGYAGADEGELQQAALVSQRFLDRAVIVAGEAGQEDPAADVASIMGYLTERWDNRISRILSVRSNIDWITYCTGLGHDQGVLPLPG